LHDKHRYDHHFRNTGEESGEESSRPSTELMNSRIYRPRERNAERARAAGREREEVRETEKKRSNTPSESVIR
jgi:hypothetical protein